MLSSIWIVSALCATALSAPTLTFSADAAARPAEMQVLSEYFQMLGSKVQAGKNMAQAPVCNLDNAVMPVACNYSSFKLSLDPTNIVLQLQQLYHLHPPALY